MAKGGMFYDEETGWVDLPAWLKTQEQTNDETRIQLAALVLHCERLEQRLAASEKRGADLDERTFGLIRFGGQTR